jgi:CIC family chloride channel protein
MTGSYGLILPLMIANMSAYAIARHFRPVPIYDALVEQDGVHLPNRKQGIGHALEQIRVENALKTDPIMINAVMTVAEAVDLVRKYEFTTFPVVDADGCCVGSITEMRLRRNLADKNGQMPVAEIADPCISIFPDQPLSEAVLKMNAEHVLQMTVVDRIGPGKVIGIITMSDIVRVQAEAISAGLGQTPISVLPSIT